MPPDPSRFPNAENFRPLLRGNGRDLGVVVETPDVDGSRGVIAERPLGLAPVLMHG